MPLLVQADEAIAHLSKSAQFADSSAYLRRFRQVQARLLALVQAHVTGLLQSMTDKILLNKVDLVTEDEKKALKARLAKINQFAAVIETERSRAPLDAILKSDSFNMESILTHAPDFFEDQEEEKKEHKLDLVQSVGIQFKGSLHAQWFNMFMMDLLKDRAADLMAEWERLSVQLTD